MASSPIRTAVAGFGLSGSVFHAPFIDAHPAYRLSMISTSDPGRQAQARTRYPQATVVQTPQDILDAAGHLDLIVLGTPPATHFPLAKAALEAGLDVVVDKPFTVRSAEGEELIDLARTAGRVLTVYQNRRWDGDALTVRKLLDAGTLGSVTRFEVGMERWAPEISKAWKAGATAEDGEASCSTLAPMSWTSPSSSLVPPGSTTRRSRPAGRRNGRTMTFSWSSAMSPAS